MTERTLSVLVVEDNPIHAEMLGWWLAEESYFHYEVELADTFSKTRQMLLDRMRECKADPKKPPFDIVILDLMLPNGAGIYLVRQLRVIDPDCVLLIWTGMKNDDEEVEILEALADEYIVKGDVDSEGFRRIVRRWAIRVQSKKKRKEAVEESGIAEAQQSTRELLQECEKDPRKPPFAPEEIRVGTGSSKSK